jgi:hypothetical protein
MTILLPPDVLDGLPDAIHEDMLGLLRRVADAGLPLEKNPNMPSMLGTRVEGVFFQITVLFDTGGYPTRVAVFAPGVPQAFGNPDNIPLVEWNRDEFLALLPSPIREPEPEPVRLSAYESLPDERLILLEIRDLLAEIRNRLP